MTKRTHPLASLRLFPSTFPSLAHPAQVLVDTDVPATCDEPRAHFWSGASSSTTPPPIVARSPFVPAPLVEHLMRNKRDSAITTKYLPGTAIPNAEAVMHSFVTALQPTVMLGDYAWQGGHSVVDLGTTVDGRRKLGRRVIMSTSLHNDFEDGQVAEAFFAVEDERIEGRDLLARGADFRVPSVAEKDNDAFRVAYDRRLKQHAVFHLMRDRLLPSSDEPPYPPWTVSQTMEYLTSYLSSTQAASSAPSELLCDRYLRLPTRRTLSLEFLLASYIASLSNELSALEALCPLSQGGYVYTFSPPSIFAQRLPTELSTLLVLLALHEIVLAHSSPASSASTATAPPLQAMRVFALGAHTPPLQRLVPLLRSVLPSHVNVLTRDALFPAPALTLRLSEGAEGATLVLHNNADAFGQNIESEAAGGSLDGVFGASSDASRGLRRDRADLLDWVA
ncbi:uncharacterized protein JCM10292_001611 [Rhodotorula paludigena]|uniref:uncharacterized protein n=1 Tax=Rhodotorula paludigena TaxID=86838 RepID=UPI003181AF1E